MTQKIRDVIIVGSGPAGYTAAIYTGRANLDVLVLAGEEEPGGELMKTTEVENYPGFPEGIMGPELMAGFEAQAERFGAEILFENATELELVGPVKKVTADGEIHLAHSVIVATGSGHRKLGLEHEERLSGRGVSYCATCDGSFFKDVEVAVVGGGDSAAEEALFLTKFASKVYLIVRGKQMRASKIMADRVRSNEKIHVLYEAQVTALHGGDKLDGVTVCVGADLASRMSLSGLFVAIGNDPRTSLVAGQLELDRFSGCIKVMGRSSQTSERGVFAAGDVVDPRYRQAITAAASGCIAAQDAEHFLATTSAAVLEAATA
ncbi:thioredoxin-disulfide reductase [Pseudarthrobacter sp. BIM B-2242]|uniref:thioredoxin-disulfide reductase n=1 Tax=Pseudarthrobacter sp. BIM B-2242 TaxID=2772401 RepID=UPI00168B83CF|nr:thioredoxin-disulfide reductase [Pseudarthrobacter sp. BIM B-2242]QOD05788.1 thioredoxin-disulfide reductase [Pseudarthrobacter sp. BIM B-2242]